VARLNPHCTDRELGRLAEAYWHNFETTSPAARDSLAFALTAGDVLIAARQQIPHGQWSDWLRQQDIDPRTARRYMQLAENQARLKTNRPGATVLSIRAALRLLGNRFPRKPINGA
jgi:hypothetical protein